MDYQVFFDSYIYPSIVLLAFLLVAGAILTVAFYFLFKTFTDEKYSTLKKEKEFLQNEREILNNALSKSQIEVNRLENELFELRTFKKQVKRGVKK